MQWLIPVIPASQRFGRLGEVDYLRSKVQDQPGQHGKTLSLLKIHKISPAWWQAPIIPATREAESGNCLNPGDRGCSEPRSCHCTPAWATERDSISNTHTHTHTHTHVYIYIYIHTQHKIYHFTHCQVCSSVVLKYILFVTQQSLPCISTRFSSSQTDCVLMKCKLPIPSYPSPGNSSLPSVLRNFTTWRLRISGIRSICSFVPGLFPLA